MCSLVWTFPIHFLHPFLSYTSAPLSSRYVYFGCVLPRLPSGRYHLTNEAPFEELSATLKNPSKMNNKQNKQTRNPHPVKEQDDNEEGEENK